MPTPGVSLIPLQVNTDNIMSSILYLPSLIAASSRDEPPTTSITNIIAQHHTQISEVRANLSQEMQLPAIEEGATILQQLAQIANNVNNVNNRFTAMENRFTRLENRLTALENRFTRTRFTARSLTVDNHFTSIETWSAKMQRIFI